MNPRPVSGTDRTFNQAGTFHVFCKYHSSRAQGDYGSGMVGTITVS